MPVTTTVYLDTPTTSSTSTPPKKVPVGAIAGGIAAGSCLAIAAVVLWIVWGRRIKRAKAKEAKEVSERKLIEKNTRHNARLAHPRSHSYRPLIAPPPPKISFVPRDRDGEKRPLDKKPSFSMLSPPKRLRAKGDRDGTDSEQSSTASLPHHTPPTPPAPAKLSTKSTKLSTSTSGSRHPDDVGETPVRSARRPPPPPPQSALPRQFSVASSKSFWSRSSRGGGTRASQMTRLSEATSVSMYSQEDDSSSNFPVGMAL